MNFSLVTITPRRSPKNDPARQLVEMYVKRANKYVRLQTEEFATEAQFLEAIAKRSGRVAPFLILTDSHGASISSTELAAQIEALANHDTQAVILAIGPADGWSPAALSRANLKIAFGRITLPHELAAVIAAEQLYRALTIRAGHPYHSGH